ncbi:MAG TPA: cbb3-type cytochrome c oxidase subunit I [Vicinamibacterales bacterium]|nr:cbb3-type cytochrome c oxidase subunit I [Vicinamibacterales bacterium]
MRWFSLDHKIIGLQYAVTSMVFLLVGFALMMLLRWQLAYPMQPIPLIGGLLGAQNTANGIMLPEFYNQLGAMHGTIMIFLGVVPLAVGGFGNYLVPLQVGASDMAFPRLNMLSYWTYLAGGIVMMASFFVPGGAPNSGWTSYPPLADFATMGQTWWLGGMLLLITSSLFGSINIIVTIVQMRAPGLTFMRLPFLVWAQLVTAFLLLLAFPPLEAAGLMQLMDRVGGSSFFLPSGLVVGQKPLAAAGGGNPLLWQHLFWFLAHPEVYVLILPAMGIVAEVIANNIRKPLWGYRLMVWAAIFLGFMSMLVWAHHMFLTGMGTAMSAFFQTTTMIVSIPSVVILTSLLMSLWGGSIRFNTPMLFALAFLPMFGLGGLTGLPLGLAASDVHLHDTYYVVGHFHYIVAPGTIFALFAGVYYWFPKVTGKMLDERLGRLHFAGSFICMNAIFMPMFIQGLAGVNRRLYDGGIGYAHAAGLQKWNVMQGWAAWALGLVQLLFLFNLAWTLWRGRRAAENPWQATTLEWSAATPPPHGNFAAVPIVRRGAYEYSVPGAAADFVLQHEASEDPPRRLPHAAPPDYTVARREDTGSNNVQLGVWLFLASEAMLFGGLFSAYFMLRAGSLQPWLPLAGHSRAAAVITLLLFGGTAAFAAALRMARERRIAAFRRWMVAAVLLPLLFVPYTLLEYLDLGEFGFRPSSSTQAATFFLLTGVHALHVAAGVLANVRLLVTATDTWVGDAARVVNRVEATRLYWYFVDAVWVILLVLFYVA